MKELFIPCSFSKLRINELFSLIDLLATAAEAMLKTPEAKAPTAELRTAATYLDTALKQSDINKYTATVEMADQAVDEAWSGIWALTKALLKHPNLERRGAAAEVYDIMYKYGNVTNLSYKEEYGRLKNLAADLDGLGAAKLTLAFIDEWFAELKKRIDTFRAADESRMAEEDARQVGLSKEARLKAEDAIRLFLKKIEALVLINGEAGYTEFVTRANTLFSETKATLKSRDTKRANETGGTPDSSLPSRKPDPEVDGLPEETAPGGDSESPDEI